VLILIVDCAYCGYRFQKPLESKDAAVNCPKCGFVCTSEPIAKDQPVSWDRTAPQRARPIVSWDRTDQHVARLAGLVRGRDCTAPQESEVASASGSRLRVQGETVYLDNSPVPLDMTAEKKADAVAFLGELLKQPGNWLSGSDIGKATQREGVRFDRVYKALPEPIKSLIESNRRKGYRVRLA
jgi:hypothetical protein